MSKVRKPYVAILFHSAGTVTVHREVERHYVKAGCLCVELKDDPSRPWWSKVAMFWRERPVILHYPLHNVFMYATPHQDHVGTTHEATEGDA
jgi:hypothetical protein